MSVQRSAGLLIFRTNDRGSIEVLIGHMGGPYWRQKDLNSWSIPKGEYEEGDEPLAAACREFEEETGQPAPKGRYRYLGELKQAGGKFVTAWAVQSNLDAATVKSNGFLMEWPRGSGHVEEFPEIDRFEWHELGKAREKLIAAQSTFIDRLIEEEGEPA